MLVRRQRTYRSVDFRQGGSPARPEGERDNGPADPGRHGLRVLLPRAIPADSLSAVAAQQRRWKPPPPTPEELELEREMEYFVEPEEAFTRDEIE
jgi:hypothetical protein